MNPFVFIKASLKKHKIVSFSFVLLVALSVGLGVGISSQERALRKGTARAADKFDLLIASPGSKTDMLFNVVFLNPSSVELLKPEQWAPLLSEENIVFAAPFAFGDERGFFLETFRDDWFKENIYWRYSLPAKRTANS